MEVRSSAREGEVGVHEKEDVTVFAVRGEGDPEVVETTRAVDVCSCQLGVEI